MNLSIKNYYYRWTKSLFVLALFFAALLTLSRLVFTLYFGEIGILQNSLPAVGASFFLGFRYDLMPISYIISVPFLIINLGYFVPGKKTIKWIRKIILLFLQSGFFLLFWIYVCDYAFYSFFQDHINILFYGLLEDDTIAVLISIWKNYNVPLWLTVFLVTHYSFFRFVNFLFSPYDFDYRPKEHKFLVPLMGIVGMIVIVFFARGNFSRLPLSIEDAHISNNAFINKISINGPLSLNRAIKIRSTFGKDNFNYLKKFKYKNWQDAFFDVKGRQPTSSNIVEALSQKTPKNTLLENNPQHVVLVVMESFGSYWNHLDGTDFNLLGDLKNHLDNGLLFKNFLPAENGTIGSVVSVSVGQVIRPGSRFLSESDFMNTPLSSSGHNAYKNKNYETHFVYGGKLGWRDLGKYLKLQGYDYIWGADEIKEALPELNNLSFEELGNEWGIFDEYLYTFIEEKLKSSKKPQFFFVLSTTNHPPFEYPISYKPLQLNIKSEFLDKLTVREDLATKRFLGLQYANQKMGEFLTKIRSGEFKSNTVVALTGDHSFWIAKGVESDQEFRRYAVPFFISLPTEIKPANYDLNKFGSHEDIFPTLYNLTLSDQSYISLGENLISEDSTALNSSGIVANKDGAFHHGQYWKWSDNTFQKLVKTSPTPELMKLKRYREGIISLTDLFLKEEKRSRKTDVKNDQQ
jgi:phosphoglycerol transferase MdoB-like AlkP superfamily enzyme